MILRVEAEGVYTLAEPDAGLELRADHLRRDNRSGEINGELSVSSTGVVEQAIVARAI